jgi:NAD-dependent deacetylase
VKRIVVLTGAGISAESGLKTFRDSNGLWEGHSVEDVATPEGFERNPDLVYRFYNERRRQLLSDEVKPNLAHKALAHLEKSFKGNFLLVTQNVDNLHEQAGSEHVIHMHGELLSARCCLSGHSFMHTDDIDSASRCSCCNPQQSLRPDIVWFGEMPFAMDDIYHALQQADLFISIGTSGNVYPAAGFVQEAKLSGAHSVEINLEPSEGQSYFDEKHYGLASVEVPKFVEQILND